ncbi:hypothetical protein [Nocardioides sp. B-3]|uniref:hypothetical protein n=1 Tax=Nocardioides sp. B-3 TaxID=2895565 RepID=UPI002152DC00|nr:hypothetical protein [Nocardioides sp. B-3]UUZ61043.1 hypothetical protein LP418_10475 [Nocardioides sp. B-3]
MSLPVPLSDSGRLEVYPAEILMVLVGLFLCLAFVSRRYVPRKHARHLLVAPAVFPGVVRPWSRRNGR